jgi:hypothetical protein
VGKVSPKKRKEKKGGKKKERGETNTEKKIVEIVVK